jgi:hypothetical protein
MGLSDGPLNSPASMPGGTITPRSRLLFGIISTGQNSVHQSLSGFISSNYDQDCESFSRNKTPVSAERK